MEDYPGGHNFRRGFEVSLEHQRDYGALHRHAREKLASMDDPSDAEDAFRCFSQTVLSEHGLSIEDIRETTEYTLLEGQFDNI
jgi:hypothetical protein